MKLISVQSNGNRFATVEIVAGEACIVTMKEFNILAFMIRRINWSFTVELALKAAAEWLREAKE